MNKKLFMALAVLVFSLVLVSGTAFAKTYNITTVYTVDSYGSTTLQDTYAWDEVPWLYFELPTNAGSNMIVASSSWYDESGDLQYSISNDYSKGTTQIWQTPGNNWNPLLGDWSVTASYTAKGPKTNGTGATSFTVTPEPISSILFLTGGATLGFRRFRKKRMST